MQSITPNAFCTLNPTWEDSMIPSPTVLVLEYAWVHVCAPYGSYVISYIEATVNKYLSFAPTLNVPDIKLYNGYIQLWGHFDNTWFEHKHNIVKDLILFDNIFNIFQCEIVWWVILEVENAYDLQIGLRLW